MYGKLFSSMYDGSLYGNWKAIVTFQQMIILCGPDGVVDMTPQALAARTSIPLDVIHEGIAVLEAPDQYSRTPDLDGRRIERLDGHRPWGWRIVNYRKYRMMVDAEVVREQNRVRQAKYRERVAAEIAANNPVTSGHVTTVTVTDVAPSNTKSRQAEAEAEGEGKKKKEEARATRFALSSCPADWVDYCQKKRPDLDPADTFEKFSNHWKAKPGAAGRKLDWTLTWRNWVMGERVQPAWAKPHQTPAEIAAEADRLRAERDRDAAH